VGTGQHRDLVPQHIRLFGLSLDHDLGVMKRGQSLTGISARTLERAEALIAERPPGVVIVEGDTNAVFAAGLAAFYHKVPVAHVEAGLRSGDIYRPFPEEMHRRLVGALATIHLAPTAEARENLIKENVPPGDIYVTGNTGIDGLFFAIGAGKGSAPRYTEPGRRLILVTAHRRENWGEGIRRVCLALRDLARRFPDVVIVYPVHPNPLVREVAESVLGKPSGSERVRLVRPLDYAEMAGVMKQSYLILTDSGGIQEEAPSLGRPVLVLRDSTERGEGVRAGCAELVGTDRATIVARASALLTDARLYKRMARPCDLYGDGRAAGRVRRALAHRFGLGQRRPADFVAGSPAGGRARGRRRRARAAKGE
jgi:UDP-N-acetylglucosamine 2-epimerase (non-hydrolysing)